MGRKTNSQREPGNQKEPYVPSNSGPAKSTSPLAAMSQRFIQRVRDSGLTVIEETEPSDGQELTATFPPNRPSRPTPRRPAKLGLRAAYLATDYVFEAEGQSHTLDIGDQNLQVRDLLARHGAQGAAYITACNPASLPLGEVHDTLAMRALRSDLKRSVDTLLVVFEGGAQGRAGVRPPEPSLMVLGVARETAEQLARRYGQYAMVWIDETGMPSLVELADLDHASRYPLNNPPFKWIELGFEWGYEWVDLRINSSQWRRILAGEGLGLQTEAWNDGKGFRLYWDFDEGVRLYVSYGDDGGTAYDGKITGLSMTLP